MKYVFYYKEKPILFRCNNLKKIESSLKVSIRRKLGISIGEYLKDLGHDVERCRVCNLHYPPLNIKVELDQDVVRIKDFSYKKLIYCYGDNKTCPGIQMNPNSFEFISIINKISLDDARVLLKSNNKSPFYKENHKSDDLYKEFQSRSIESYKNKYGEDLGQKKYLEHISKISTSNSREGYIKKYGEELGDKLFKEVSSKKDSMSFDFFVKKNKGDFKLAFNEYEYRLSKVNNSVENLIKRHGEEIALIKHDNRVNKYRESYSINTNKEEINKSKGITIDNLFMKYGNIDVANKKYNDWIRKVSVPICRASKESLLLFHPLIEILITEFSIDIDDIYIGDKNKKEYFIKEGNKIYFYDFTIRSKKIIIEYNGIMFHPKNENSTWINPFDIRTTNKEAFYKQKNKLDIAINKGFNVLEIWSDDNNKFEKCLEFIRKNINK
jgi:hypothetical protein